MSGSFVIAHEYNDGKESLEMQSAPAGDAAAEIGIYSDNSGLVFGGGVEANVESSAAMLIDNFTGSERNFAQMGLFLLASSLMLCEQQITASRFAKILLTEKDLNIAQFYYEKISSLRTKISWEGWHKKLDAGGSCNISWCVSDDLI